MKHLLKLLTLVVVCCSSIIPLTYSASTIQELESEDSRSSAVDNTSTTFSKKGSYTTKGSTFSYMVTGTKKYNASGRYSYYTIRNVTLTGWTNTALVGAPTVTPKNTSSKGKTSTATVTVKGKASSSGNITTYTIPVAAYKNA